MRLTSRPPRPQPASASGAASSARDNCASRAAAWTSGLPDLTPREAAAAASARSSSASPTTAASSRRTGLPRSSQRSTPASTSPRACTSRSPACRRSPPRRSARAGRLIEVRQPAESFMPGTGKKRSGKRVLTVGTDCAVGKKYTALAIEKELRARGVDADFRATGQTGHLHLGPRHRGGLRRLRFRLRRRRVAVAGCRTATLGRDRGPGVAVPSGLRRRDARAHPRQPARRDGAVPRPRAHRHRRLRGLCDPVIRSLLRGLPRRGAADESGGAICGRQPQHLVSRRGGGRARGRRGLRARRRCPAATRSGTASRRSSTAFSQTPDADSSPFADVSRPCRPRDARTVIHPRTQGVVFIALRSAFNPWRGASWNAHPHRSSRARSLPHSLFLPDSWLTPPAWNDSARAATAVPEAAPALSQRAAGTDSFSSSGVTEAPTGFDNLTNGFCRKGPPYELSTKTTSCRCARSTTTASSSRRSRRSPTASARPTTRRAAASATRTSSTGGASQVAEHRTGRMDGERVLRVARRLADPVARDAPGHRRARRVRGQHPHVPHLDQHARRRLRRGDREQHAARDPRPPAAAMRGTALMVPVLEANGAARIGRFGWKSQHASLESFAADAYLNEMGITSRCFPRRTRRAASTSVSAPTTTRCRTRRTTASMSSRSRTSCARRRRRRAARSRAKCARASRSSRASAARPATCRRSPRRRPARRSTAARSRSPRALGNKIIHPYSDFLLHDIGTGDGIPFLPTPEFAATATPDQDRAALGAAHAQPPDARRPLVHEGGSDRAPRRPGRAVTAAFNALTPQDRPCCSSSWTRSSEGSRGGAGVSACASPGACHILMPARSAESAGRQS